MNERVQNSLGKICKLYQDIILDAAATLTVIHAAVGSKEPDTVLLIRAAIEKTKIYQREKLAEVATYTTLLKEEVAVSNIMEEAGIKPIVH